MNTKMIEATNGPLNWGKFLLARFDAAEWARRSKIDDRSLIGGRGWTAEHILVLDLQTGEGAIFLPGGLAAADLESHRIWVCPLFQPMLEWLYKQDTSDLDALPDHVDLPKAPFLMAGHRRDGPREARA
jgi:hypothetical protein